MATLARHQRLPSAGPQREALREKGQFWTPPWVAEAMVGYVLQGPTDHVFDPAVGAGVFFHAAKAVGRQLARPLTLLGTEIDPLALTQAANTGLTADDLAHIQIQDFVLHPPARHFQAIVANPPYIRHHRLPATTKASLQDYGKRLTGSTLDGRAGLHIYFLLRALQLLETDGRLAFIMPADTCEGKFAPALWSWITAHYCLEAVVTFTPDATPFPGVDTNAIVFMIRNAAPQSTFHWAQVDEAHTDQLKLWTLAGFQQAPTSAVHAHQRILAEALQTGFSRPPAIATETEATLSDFATVMRGIATGANDFFFLTNEQKEALGIPNQYVRRAIGRTRDVPTEEITQDTLTYLDKAGRPTWLLSLDGQPVELLPLALRCYVHEGEHQLLPQRALISTRRPWYKMETRTPPPFLFAYLGRRNARFIRNTAGVLPLTCFLCVYPRQQDPATLDKLWQVLQHPATIANLARVGKSYGAGAIKVEPRALERLPIPHSVLEEFGLASRVSMTQASLF